MSISPAIRLEVSKRAGERCEYCLLPDIMSTHSPHVDHIIALKHSGTDELSNLAWSCASCNVNKGTDIASIDVETDALTLYFNPRQQVWTEHFEIVRYDIIGLTAIGRVTSRMLKMNNEQHTAMRQILIDAGRW